MGLPPFILQSSNETQIIGLLPCLANRVNHQDHLVEILVPDVCPVDVVEIGQDFSMCAGEFVEVRKRQSECG